MRALLSSGRVVAQPYITPIFEFCSDRGSYVQNVSLAVICYKVPMLRRQPLIGSASICMYFVLSFVVLYWFDDGSLCARSPLRSTLGISLVCTVWDLFACEIGSWVAQKLMKLRTAAPLLAGAITGTGLASIPFWIYRGYGHFLFEGTWADISCFFAEGRSLAFPFIVAPVLGLLTLIHGAFWLRIGEERPISAAR